MKNNIFKNIKKFYFYISPYIVLGFIIAWLISNVIGYFSFLPKATVLNMIKTLETNYFYKDVFEDVDYKNRKNELLSQSTISKFDFYKFIEEVKNYNDDKYSYFIYDDFINNKKLYSKVVNRDVNFKYSVDKKHNYGYISFKVFKNGVGNKFVEHIKMFNSQNIKNLIIDLRDNGGGYDIELITIADALLPECEIYNSTYNKSKIIKYSDSNYYNFDKIFIFLNEKSASCSEILALTLRENLKDKVILIGNKTEGKGVGQVTYDNSNYRYKYYIVSNKWHVYNKNISDLHSYLNYKNNFNKNEDYYEIVFNVLNK